MAAYIGVFQTPQNEKEMKIEMTAPVAVKHKKEAADANASEMDFFLPSAMDQRDKIPNPNFEDVRVSKVEPAIGAVLR